MVLAQPTRKCALLCSRPRVSPRCLALVQDGLNRRRLLGSSSDSPSHPHTLGSLLGDGGALIGGQVMARTRGCERKGRGQGCKEYTHYFLPTNLPSSSSPSSGSRSAAVCYSQVDFQHSGTAWHGAAVPSLPLVPLPASPKSGATSPLRPASQPLCRS